MENKNKQQIGNTLFDQKWGTPHPTSPYKGEERRGWILTGLKVFLVMSSAVLFLSAQQPVLAAGLMGQEMEIVRLTNQLRQAQGISMLSINSQLTSSAQAKANDMATNNYFGHADKSGNRMAYWMSAAGYSYVRAGENLAKGFTNPEDLMAAWTSSPTHYANLINPNYQEMGVGIAQGYMDGQPTIFVVQHFGQPLPVADLLSDQTNPLVLGDKAVVIPPSTDGAIKPSTIKPNLWLQKISDLQVPTLDIENSPSSETISSPASYLLASISGIADGLSTIGIFPHPALAAEPTRVVSAGDMQAAQAAFVVLIVLGLGEWLLSLIWPVFYAAWLSQQKSQI